MTRDVDSDRHEIREHKDDSKTRIHVSGSGETASLRYAVEAEERSGGQPQYEKIGDKKRYHLQELDEEVHRVTTLNLRN